MLDAAFPARSTPFPSYLLDDVMPLLSDTEWRLLCVFVRQTLGWEDGQGGRKRADWLTQSQLKARTGRASEAVSRAIDGLVQKGLIQVCTRRRERSCNPAGAAALPGRLFCSGWLPQGSDAPQNAPGMRRGKRPFAKRTRPFGRRRGFFGFRSSETEHDKRNPEQNHTYRCAARTAPGWG